MTARILLAEDDASLRYVLSQALTREGYVVRATSNTATLAKWVKDGEGELVVSDVYMGDECVFDTLPGLRRLRPDIPFIVMSAQSTVSTAMSAAEAGAFEYLPKPFDLEALISAVKRGLSKGPDARTRAAASKAERDDKLPLIGRSAAMQDLYRTMARVAPGDIAVVIEGEAGVGKTRVARALHAHGPRVATPFRIANLAGISPARLEQDVFGARGAFAEAEGGALLLKDIDEASPETQARLAGLLKAADDEGAPRVRLIAAARPNLAARVRAGQFRQDLFDRLDVVTIRVPPLRDRRDDIPDLALAFLARLRREGGPAKTLDAGAIDLLKDQPWPGNVRELQTILARAAVLSPADVLSAADLAHHLRARAGEDAVEAPSLGGAIAARIEEVFAAAAPDLPAPGLHERVLADVERPLIARALHATKGNQIRAAALLGINRNTLRKKIQVLGVLTGPDD